MNILSIYYIAFVLLTLVLYYILPHKLQWIVLLVASLAFYLTCGWKMLPFILASSLIGWGAGRMMNREYEKNGTTGKKKCKRILIVSIALLTALLLYAKIGVWVMETFAALLKLEHDGAFKVIVALGISYYTFSLISYVADVYWRKDTAEKNYFRFLLFVSYFPKILQGPISRHKNLAPQLAAAHKFDYTKLCHGLQRSMWGFFKKLVIADRCALLTNTVFGNPGKYEGQIFLVAAVFSAIEIYCDFSGCMDIVIGVSEAFGIELEENFQRPFYSKSAAEFWRRWHITLGTWFKDYIYMPLMISPRLIKISKWLRDRTGTRSGKIFMTVIPLSAVWLLTGLWHNTKLYYVVWGAYWGTLIILSAVLAPEMKKLRDALHLKSDSVWYKMVQTVRTFIIFLGSRIITAPGDIKATWEIIKSIFTKFNPWIYVDGTLYSLGIGTHDFWVGIIAAILLWKVDSMQEKGIRLRDRLDTWPLVLRWSIYYLCFFAILIFGIYGSGRTGSTFVYMQF